MLWLDPKALEMLGKNSSTKPHPQLTFWCLQAPSIFQVKYLFTVSHCPFFLKVCLNKTLSLV